MLGHRRAPGVEDGEQPDAGAEVLGIGCDGDQGLGRGLEQQVVDRGLVLVGDVGDPSRQGEYYVSDDFVHTLRARGIGTFAGKLWIGTFRGNLTNGRQEA